MSGNLNVTTTVLDTEVQARLDGVSSSTSNTDLIKIYRASELYEAADYTIFAAEVQTRINAVTGSTTDTDLLKLAASIGKVDNSNSDKLDQAITLLERGISLTDFQDEVAPLAKSSELAPLATRADLNNLAKTTDLAPLARSTELTNLVKSSELSPLAKSSDLNNLATSTELSNTESTILASLESSGGGAYVTHYAEYGKVPKGATGDILVVDSSSAPDGSFVVMYLLACSTSAAREYGVSVVRDGVTCLDDITLSGGSTSATSNTWLVTRSMSSPYPTNQGGILTEITGKSITIKKVSGSTESDIQYGYEVRSPLI